MSTTGALDRATLDSKDRAELQTIAQAMGGKPGSRLRKAEIVDLILDLAGGSSSGSSGSGSTSAKSASAKSASAKGGTSSRSNGKSDDVVSLFDDKSNDDTSDDAKEESGDDKSDDAAGKSGDKTSDSSDDSGDGSDDDAKGKSGDKKSDDADDTSDDDAKGKSDKSDDGDSGEKSDGDRGGRNRDGQRGDNRGDRNDRSEGRNRGGDNRDGDKRGDNRDGDKRGGDNKGGRNRDRNRDGRNNDGRNNDGRNNDGRNDGDGKGGRNRDRNNQGGRNNNNQDQTEPGNRKRRRRGGRDRDEEVPPWDGEPVPVEGYLDLRSDGYGFLRVGGSLPTNNDVYIPVKTVRQHGLRRGDHLKGKSRPANRNEKNPALLELESVNGGPIEAAKKRPVFEDLTPLFPDETLRLERPDDNGNMTTRIIDLISPVGKGQRGLIVSPPKAGKTTIVKEIVRSIEVNNPEVKVLVLLVDERPEEVTDMRRWLVRGEVVASTFDRPSDEHTAVAEMTIERAKRMVEFGEDVVIVLDGITRLARAYNLAAPATGRIMSGGVDSGALYPPKRFFGAARNVEEGGSLTILATALVETGSKMDEVIFEEFKGTGNMELRLDRKTAERRIYPAIDVDASSTRHEELLFERRQLNQVWKLRRVLSGMANDDDNHRGNAAGLELLIDRLKTFDTNAAFLDEVARGPVG